MRVQRYTKYHSFATLPVDLFLKNAAKAVPKYPTVLKMSIDGLWFGMMLLWHEKPLELIFLPVTLFPIIVK